MQQKILKTTAYLTGMRTLKDGSIKFEFESQELDAAAGAAAFALRNSYGFLLFAPNELNESDIPQSPAPLPEEEYSPSQRLRRCLYVWWFQLRQRGKNAKNFEDFYRSKMEEIVERVKEKLL